MKRYYSHFIRIAVLGIAMCTGAVAAQDQTPPADTVTITLQTAEAAFLTNNLQLLASKYSISAAQAAVVQAQLWNNPNISIEQNVVNQQTGRWFDVTSSGNTEIALQQLILLAGKRGKQVRVSEVNQEIAQFTFSDLLRTLKSQLRNDFYSLHFLRETLRFYDESIPELAKTVEVTEASQAKGAVLLAEVLRLKSLLLTLETGRVDILTQIADLQNDLRVLLNDAAHPAALYIPRIDSDQTAPPELVLPTLDELIARAIDARPDLKIAAAVVRQEEANLALQRALAIPDLTLGGRWSRAGNYIPDYYALSVSIDLPLFNRNQGNIAVSEATLDADKAAHERARQQVVKDVTGAYYKLVETDKLYRSFERKFPGQYAMLVEGTLKNYHNRNMTVIEFTDFFESYWVAIQQYYQLQNNRIAAIEELNYKAGTDVLPTTTH